MWQETEMSWGMNNKERRMLIKIVKLLALIHKENVTIMCNQAHQMLSSKKAEKCCEDMKEYWEYKFNEILNESIYDETGDAK